MTTGAASNLTPLDQLREAADEDLRLARTVTFDIPIELSGLGGGALSAGSPEEVRGAADAPQPSAAAEIADGAPDFSPGPSAGGGPTIAADFGLDADPNAARMPESPLFESLEPDAFVDLLQKCQRRLFQAGDRLIAQGEPARSFFVLSEGELRVVQSPAGDPDQQIDLARLHSGDFFGELALVSDSPRIASVIAETDGEALEFPGAVLRQLVREYPAAEAALNRFARARLLQNAMSTSPLFRPFDRAQRKHLIARFVIREVPPHAPVLVEGVPSDGLYVVMQGRFRVERNRQRLATLGVGDVFGEISLLSGTNAGASVVAESLGKVLRLPRKAFEELILTHPQVLEMVSQLADEREKLNEGVQSGKIACDTEGLILM